MVDSKDNDYVIGVFNKFEAHITTDSAVVPCEWSENKHDTQRIYVADLPDQTGKLHIEWYDSIQNKTIDSFGTEIWETVAYWYSALVCNPSYEVAPVFIKESDEYRGLYLMFTYDENTYTIEQVYPITVAEAVSSSLGNVAQQVKDLESMVKGIYGEAV